MLRPGVSEEELNPGLAREVLDGDRGVGNLGKAPDLILVAGNVLTAGQDLPQARAVAVRDGLILAVGSEREILSLAGSGTSVIECPGKCVVPGFDDAHIHLLACAGKRLAVDCSPPAVMSVCDIQQAIQARARSVPPSTWIRAGN